MITKLLLIITSLIIYVGIRIFTALRYHEVVCMCLCLNVYVCSCSHTCVYASVHAYVYESERPSLSSQQFAEFLGESRVF